MKKLIFLIIGVLLFASFNIDEEIKMLQKLPPQKRFILMNKIKKQLIKLNKKQREKILKKLSKQYQKENDNEENPIIENQTSKGEK